MIKLTVFLGIVFLAGFVLAHDYPCQCKTKESEQSWVMGSAPLGNGKWIIAAAMDLYRPLKSGQSAAIICFRTNKYYNYWAGAKGFGFQVWCAAPECKYDYQLGASYFGSYLKKKGPDVWAGNGYDLSHTNKGVHDFYGEQDVTTYYEMTDYQFDKSNFPAFDKTEYFVCYSKFCDDFYDVNLLTDIKFDSSWIREELTASP